MTVSSDTRRVQYATNGTIGPFAITFPFLSNSHIAVTHTDSSAVETVLVLNVGFTIAGSNVTMTTAYPLGGTITITRNIPILQELDLRDGDSFPAESVEDAFDLLTMIVQKLGGDIDRAIRVPEVSTFLPDLPAAATRASKMLGFDSLGNPTAITPTAGSALDVLLQLAATSGSSLIGLIQAGTGAAARTSQDKLRESISVNDFGAGSSKTAAENAAAFVLAMNHAISTRNGCDVHFPDDYYAVNAATVIGYRDHATETDGVRKLGNVRLYGQGGGNNDSIFEGDGGTTIEYTGAGGGIFDFTSSWDCTVERIQFKCSAASTPAYLVRARSELAPVVTGTSLKFRQVVFWAESAPSEAQVVLRDHKGVSFDDCRWPTSLGTNGILLIGENQGVNATLVDGQVYRTQFRNCVFAGDTTIRQAQAILWDSCEWFPRKGSTEGAKITLAGDKEWGSFTFINPKADDHSGPAGTFLDMLGSTGRGGLLCLGGQLGAYQTVFRSAAFGSFIAQGTRFIQQLATANDIILTAGVGPVRIDCIHLDTIAAGNTPIVDGRTLPVRPYIVNAVGAGVTLSSTSYEDVITQANVVFKGGMLRVTYGFSLSSLRTTRYDARVRVGSTTLAGTWCANTVTNAHTMNVTFTAVIPSPGLAVSASTVRLQVQQLSAAADFATINAHADPHATFLQIEELT
jgi:hypothetical protein